MKVTRDKMTAGVIALTVVVFIMAGVDLLLPAIAEVLPEKAAVWFESKLLWGLVSIAICAALTPLGLKVWRKSQEPTGTETEAAVFYDEPPQETGGEAGEGEVVLRGAKRLTLTELSNELHRLGKELEPDVTWIIDLTLSQAILVAASDVHFEAGQTWLNVRYRVDGTLVDIAKLPRELHFLVINRLKVMSNLPPFERNKPQDGRIFAKIGGQDLDIRISFLPTLHGEKAALRIFETSGERFDLGLLGLSRDMRRDFFEILTRPQGIVFVTGPTGSGKTTTMYSSLRYIKSVSAGMINIVSLEDPVEYSMAEFSQTQVDEKSGLTFAKGLRTILRQDPDVIMVGEIRDHETAHVALQAGLTGHLMLTTVHADSTVGVFSRLINMGIEPFLLSSATIAVLSQRLVRCLCPVCRVPTQITERQQRILTEGGIEVANDATFFAPKGCDHCFTSGYRGRTVLAELLPVDDAIKQGLTSGIRPTELEEVARKQGMRTLLENGIAKAMNEVTSISEVLRVTR